MAQTPDSGGRRVVDWVLLLRDIAIALIIVVLAAAGLFYVFGVAQQFVRRFQ